MFWSHLTWAELPEALQAASQAAILPVGATEQHGPHMGCGMDTEIADKLCRAVSKETGVPMLRRCRTAARWATAGAGRARSRFSPSR